MMFLDDGDVQVYQGDCREVMRELDDASIDAICTDPPYEIGFMGRGWDASGVACDPAVWDEALRVLKPGGHVAAFGATRTAHRMACAIEDAGFEIRDTLCWLYGSGFPKSLDVSKAIDKANGAAGSWSQQDHPGRAGARKRDGSNIGQTNHGTNADNPEGLRHIYVPGSDEARTWQGWGTALKPAHEPIVLARKPLAGTVARNVLEHGTGAINIDETRIGTEERETTRSDGTYLSDNGSMAGHNTGRAPGPIVTGRWPANVVLDEEAGAMLDAQTGVTVSTPGIRRNSADAMGYGGSSRPWEGRGHDDSGGASRFFYTAKASSADRALTTGGKSDHPTVKPVDLMRWLVRLLTPPGGLILDPFLGSGTTAVAARLEGFRCIGIEQHEPYARIAADRLSQQSLLGGAA